MSNPSKISLGYICLSDHQLNLENHQLQIASSIYSTIVWWVEMGLPSALFDRQIEKGRTVGIISSITVFFPYRLSARPYYGRLTNGAHPPFLTSLESTGNWRSIFFSRLRYFRYVFHMMMATTYDKGRMYCRSGFYYFRGKKFRSIPVNNSKSLCREFKKKSVWVWIEDPGQSSAERQTIKKQVPSTTTTPTAFHPYQTPKKGEENGCLYI